MIQIPWREDIKNTRKRSFDKIYLKFCAKCNFTISEPERGSEKIKREMMIFGYLMQREIGQNLIQKKTSKMYPKWNEMLGHCRKQITSET